MITDFLENFGEIEVKTEADYELILETIYIEISSSIAAWGKLYGLFVESKKTGQKSPFSSAEELRKEIVSEAVKFQEDINPHIGKINSTNPRLIENFKMINTILENLKNLPINEVAKIGSYKPSIADLNSIESIKELKCNEFFFRRVNYIGSHIGERCTSTNFASLDYLVITIKKLEDYKTYLTKLLSEEKSSTISDNFDKKKQEIKDEISFTDLLIKDFCDFQEKAKASDVESAYTIHNIHHILPQKKMDEYYQNLANSLSEKGFFTDFVIGLAEELITAKFDAQLLLSKITFGGKDEHEAIKSKIEFKKASDIVKYRYSRLRNYISKSVGHPSCNIYLNEVESHFLDKEPPEKYISDFENFLALVSKESLNTIGIVQFFGKWFQNFEETFEETEKNEEVILGSFIKIRSRLVVLERLFNSEIKLGEKKEEVSEAAKVFNDMLIEAKNTDIKNTESVKKTYELVKAAIRGAKRKFNDKIILANLTGKDSLMSEVDALQPISSPAVTLSETILISSLIESRKDSDLSPDSHLQNKDDILKQKNLGVPPRNKISPNQENSEIKTDSKKAESFPLDNESLKKPWFRRVVDWIERHISSSLAKRLNSFLDNFLGKYSKDSPISPENAQNKSRVSPKVGVKIEEIAKVTPPDPSFSTKKDQKIDNHKKSL